MRCFACSSGGKLGIMHSGKLQRFVELWLALWAGDGVQVVCAVDGDWL